LPISLNFWAHGVHGVIFSNELLDAMPVHRLVWHAQQKRWIESAIALQDGTFVWSELASLTVEQPRLPRELLDVLPDGYVIEVCPAAKDWWTNAARTLHRGTLLTIDYGGVVEELLSPGKTRGTLRGYSRHRATDDVLANPGETGHNSACELFRTAKGR
jgi:SAM-dependent MidA family methyltransferase